MLSPLRLRQASLEPRSRRTLGVAPIFSVPFTPPTATRFQVRQDRRTDRCLSGG
jgi:hypothetical protein